LARRYRVSSLCGRIDRMRASQLDRDRNVEMAADPPGEQRGD
jgi:hypothetical protein